MANATTIDPQEARHFGKMAADWWNPKGSSAMLHQLNPVRLRYIRQQIDRHWHKDSQERRPLSGLRALDVGCGAGLLCEPLTRLGAAVTGIDAAPENIAVAKLHAQGEGLEIAYHHRGIESVHGKSYDLVTSLEVVEHVTDPAIFVTGLAKCLAPGGLMILSTPNRTPLSKLAMITLAEGLGKIPKGTHDWNKFLTPDELTQLITAAGLKVLDITGMEFTPTQGFKLGKNMSLDYFVTASWK